MGNVMRFKKAGPKQRVLIIPDGAGDLHRDQGLTPLAAARTPQMDWVARSGSSGLMQTLYPDLPLGSLVAHLGMLGWDPYLWHPQGRASCELLALSDISLRQGDLAFRANLVTMDGNRLRSYNAGYLVSEQARNLLEKIRGATRHRFPEFELYHNSDFRNTLVVRGAGIRPGSLTCSEPHESEGETFDPATLVRGSDPASREVARRLNDYLETVAGILGREAANMLFPWSASSPFSLPPFRQITGFDQPTAMVASMDFLSGLARAGEIEFFKVGDGSPETDYRAKGRRVTELLREGYGFVVCHVNAPDEAAHMGDRGLKIWCLEQIDRFVVGPVVDYFRERPESLGSLMIVPDHYTNCPEDHGGAASRGQSHSLHPVPFALWNGEPPDGCQSFCEDAARGGRHGAEAVNHLQLLELMGFDRLASGGSELEELPGKEGC